ncbi:MAG TPA: hypothetical protein VFB08_19120 [Burkholderiales bacterium]|nr:hypothetical protein [Burkholderiales bacterium]
MTTKLEKPLKREIQIGGKPFVVTISQEGFKLVGKGRRKGLEVKWEDLTSGEAAMAVALKASLDRRVNLEPGKASSTLSSGKRSSNKHKAVRSRKPQLR